MKYFNYIPVILALLPLCATSCREETGISELEAEASISICVPCLNSGSRAYDDLDPEFRINDLTLFFFKSEGFSEADSRCVWKYVIPSAERFEGASAGSFTLSFALPIEVRPKLFAEAASCMVYAMANVRGGLLDTTQQAILEEDNLTIGRLRGIISGASFADGSDEEFIMDTLAELPYSQGRLSGELSLERLASRITLRLSLPPIIGSRYEYARQSETRAWISYGADTGSLDCNPENTALYSQEFTSTSGSSFLSTGSGLAVSAPFYSYPRTWDGTAPNLSSGTVITLRTYWRDSETDAVIPSYYRIPVQHRGKRIERNKSYDIHFSADRLGSPDISHPVEISDIAISATPWNKKNFGAGIGELRYLLLHGNDYDTSDDTYSYNLHNGTEISIPFKSSHPVEISRIDIEWDDMANRINDLRPRVLSITDMTDSAVSSYEEYSADNTRLLLGVTADNETSRIMFTRGLFHFAYEGSSETTEKEKIEVKPDIRAITPYRFTFHLRHIDDHNTSAKVVVTQYPAIYLTRIMSGGGSDLSSPTRYVNGYSSLADRESGKGFILQTSSNDALFLGSLHNDNRVQNKNIYTAHITEFSFESEEYVLGDPRSHTIDNIPYNNTDWSRPGVTPGTGETKSLTHYYPTMSGNEYNRYITPSFSIASQWGITINLSHDQARRRCASYQEQGKPAGRWRLPTHAEIEFIANLSAKGLIPSLFGTIDDKGVLTNATYWTGSGAIKVDVANNIVSITDNTSTLNPVRCVYDDWYWQDDDCNPAVFTWGDSPRDPARSRKLLNTYKR